MEVTPRIQGDLLTLTLKGRLAADSVAAMDRPWLSPGIRRLELDLGECEYVSSAGLRVFLKLAREAKAQGVGLALVNVLPSVEHTLEVTGLTQLFTVRPRAREISIEGLEFLSAGLCGECFRLDADTIVKLYNEGVSREIAEQEKDYAKAAFVAGIPTALSYDVVCCGSRTGVVYEMLDAQLFSRVIAADPDNAQAYGRQLAQIAGTIHSIPGDPSVFPDLKSRLKTYIEGLRDALSDDEVWCLLQRLESVPQADTLVHFDLHTSNIMIRDGEPVIIDMGDVSRGCPLFDVGVIALIFGYPETGGSEFVTRVPNQTGRILYESFIETYFVGRPVWEREFFERNADFLACLRLIAAVAFLPFKRDELMPKIRQFLAMQQIKDRAYA